MSTNMNLEKQYIVQCLIIAANNLRLSSEKIEVVALIKDKIQNSEDLGKLIIQMKKTTELSKFGIKLGEIHNYISNSKIDFLKISDVFKEHSHALIKEFSNLLDQLTPLTVRKILSEIDKKVIKVDLSHKTESSVSLEDINVNPAPSIESKSDESDKAEENKIKEKIIFDDLVEPDEFNFDNFEQSILKPIKELDAFLKKLSEYEIADEDLDKYHQIIENNAKFSQKVGFEMITKMHMIFLKSLELMKLKKLIDIESAVEGMRACLIVIVAVVRQKEVDITGYLNKAEEFGNKIKNIK